MNPANTFDTRNQKVTRRIQTKKSCTFDLHDEDEEEDEDYSYWLKLDCSSQIIKDYLSNQKKEQPEASKDISNKLSAHLVQTTLANCKQKQKDN